MKASISWKRKSYVKRIPTSWRHFTTVPFYTLSLSFILILFIWPHCVTCRILVPWLGIELMPPGMEAQNHNPWTAREVPKFDCLTLLVVPSTFLVMWCFAFVIPPFLQDSASRIVFLFRLFPFVTMTPTPLLCKICQSDGWLGSGIGTVRWIMGDWCLDLFC